ncbi:uncharacterized protein METZ01_LOCUS511139, partial [marine metagenome]
MKSLFVGLLAFKFCFAAQAASISDSITTIRAVGTEGRGNAAASKAWKTLSQAEANALPQILRSMKGASPLAANWFRASVDTIASRSKDLPVTELVNFIKDHQQDPLARRLAFELIQSADPNRAEKLIPGLINDPSVELRREAVAQAIEEGNVKKDAKKNDAAIKSYRKALNAARDIDQIQTATTA